MTDAASARLSARGPRADLMVGYQWAATIQDWTIDVGVIPRTAVFRGRVAAAHDYYGAGRRPFALVAQVGSARWRWEGIDLAVAVGDRVEVLLCAAPRVTDGG